MQWLGFFLLLLPWHHTLASSQQCSWEPSKAVLGCAVEHLSSIAFAKHQREATRTLEILCQTQLVERLLDHDRGRGGQNPWPHLQTLSVQQCPLTAISLHGDVLQDVIKPLLGGRSLSGLRHLDLIGDDYSDYTSDLWCEVGSNLLSLNLSSNGLSQAPSAARKSCRFRHLEVLRLSDNAISELDDEQSVLLKSDALTHLDVSRNRLQFLRLSSAKKLQWVDVSENKLNGGLLETLSGSRESLSEVHAQGNQMTSLPNLSTSQGSIVNFDKLVVLNLSRNSIGTPEDGEVLLGMSQLVALDLSHNKLSFVDEHLFSGLTSLQVLSLANNQIVEFRPESLAKLTRLHVLVLSHNNLDDKGLGEKELLHMADLRSLSLDHNRLKSLPRELFRGCSSLRDLSLSANFLRQWPSSALQPIAHHLHTLDMGENSLRELEPLSDFKQLYGLRLAGNRLRNLTADTFNLCPSMRMLNVADNLLEHIDLATFEPLKHLKALRLDNNRLEDINGLLTVQHQLQWLNVSHNHLQWFDYAIIPKSVIWLSLRHNRIEELGNYYNMQDGFHLTHLDVGHNALLRMDGQALQTSLTEIHADHNSIGELAPNMFKGLANLTVVNLTNNRLQTFPLTSLSLSLSQGSTQIWLDNNPLSCDCEMEWLQRVNSLAAKSPREFPMVADWASLRCRLNNRGGHHNTSLLAEDVVVAVSSVRPSEFLCPYETHCFALCMCCDFFACDCRMKCSDGCHCFHDQTWSSNIIECGNRDHKKVPEFIPMDATAVYLDGNHLDDKALANDEFIGRKHLTSLYLNRSQISLVSNQTFKGLSELLVLHLEDNRLTRLDSGQEFDELNSLRELYLHNNALEFIHSNTLEPLLLLQILTLHGNRLTVADFHVWDYMRPPLTSLSLANNPWSCQCDAAEKFAAALKANPGLKVRDLDDVKCFNNSVLKKNNSACADVLAVSFRSDDDDESLTWDSFLPVIAVAVASTVIVISLIILAVAARKPIRSWFQRRYDGIQRSNIYGTVTAAAASAAASASTVARRRDQILVLSASVDQDFVCQTFMTVLEAQGYQAEFHCLPGGSPPSLASSVDKSRGVCVVASHLSYIQNNPQDLLTLSKLCCRDHHSRPLILVALDTTAAKTLRRIPVSEVRSSKTLLWDTKSFWPTWHSLFPLPKSLAVKSEEDMWTYLKPGATTASRNANASGGSSSLSTQSTDTMTKVMSSAATLRGFSTHRGSSQQKQFNSPMASSMMHSSSSSSSKSNKSLHRQQRPTVIENPMATYHHRKASAVVESEPIYHSLDEDDVTVYINADLEVVYPSLGELQEQRHRLNNLQLEDEAELSGLLTDCYESSEYVPSPAPGSFPRHHLSYTAASDRRASSGSKKQGGYLV